MPWTSRRTILSLSMLGTLLGLSIVGHVNAQKAKPIRQPIAADVKLQPAQPAPKKPSHDLGNLVLPTEDDLTEKVEFIADKIKLKEWKSACDNLQALIGKGTDVWVPITRKAVDGTTNTAYVSVKKEALRMLGNMPKEGMQWYRDNIGPKALKEFKFAKENGNPIQMGTIMALYLYTDAGLDAGVWLATHMLDRAEVRGASNIFMRLIQERASIKDLKVNTLIKAAYAFHFSGETAGKNLVFKELERRGVEIKLRDRTLAVADLRDEIDKLVSGIQTQSANDSPIFRGGPNRTTILPGGTAFMEPVWKFELWRTDAAKLENKKAENAIAAKAMPLLTTLSPITATMTQAGKQVPLVICRSQWGVHALDMKTGKTVWNADSDLSIEAILGASGTERDASKVNAYSTWLGHYLQSSATARPQILYENSVLNTLSTDNKFVYAVEDLPVPPPMSMMNTQPGFGQVYNWGQEITAAIDHNKLFAYDLTREGKAAWEIGGTAAGPLADTYFLGPPLPLNGRLYVLAEKLNDLRLLTIDPPTGKVLQTQVLANTKGGRLAHEPMRRIQACHLSYAEGVLVVPTNAGAIFGVDLFANTLLWAYPYRNKDSIPVPPNIQPWMPPPPGWIRNPAGQLVPANSDVHWQVTAPAIADGKVVMTAPDEKDIHCVNLRDGTRVWSAPRDNDDLYMAGVFNGKVVIVGKNRTRALSLAKGEEVWRVETGKPSGLGAASMPAGGGDVLYYVPIRESVATREPEIVAINVDKGIIHAHTRSRKREMPGNLIFFEGTVLSQTNTEMVAYPQLEFKLTEMDRLVKANPDDPEALTERGDYLLDKGDLPKAIADFRKALKQEKIPTATRAKARAKLHESFTELFQRDFAKGEEYINEYEELCKIDLAPLEGPARTAAMAEIRRRRANFLCLVGKGREGQNRLVEAFEKYLELGMEARQDELIQVVDEPTVKTAPDVWSQGRIASMVANAKDAKQKAALEEEIRKRWDKIKSKKAPPLNELRKFVALFGSLFDVGKEGRLALADRLIDDPAINSLLEAEQQLSLLRGESEKPEIAARALEALARLNQNKKRLEDAAYYYRKLAEQFPKIKINGKTGSEFLDDLSTDKRYWPYIDQAGRFTIKGKVNLKDEVDQKAYNPVSTQTYNLAHIGEQLPFFVRHKVGVTLDWTQNLEITDVATGDVQKLPLTRTLFSQIATTNSAPHRVKFSYQTMGHLVVVQLGHMIFGIDPLNKPRVLWEKNLSTLPGAATAPPTYASMTHDAKDNSLQLVYSDGWVQRLGQAGPLQGTVITMPMRDSLVAIDPITGRTLWTRSDVTSRAQIFGDQENVYVVHLSDDGKPSGTRVFRAYDGVTVKAKDFSNLYTRRIGLQGRTILLSDTQVGKAGEANTTTLRMYDIVKGEDVWKEQLPVDAVMLTSEDPKLAGFIDSKGAVRVFDVEKRMEVLKGKLHDPKHLDKPQTVYLISDPDYIYLAINGQPDPNIPAWAGGIQSNILSTSGLRSIPVNGWVYSFKRKTGGIQWFNKVENQQMIVSMMDELPMVLFTSRYSYLMPPPNRFQVMKYTALAFAKHSGKQWYENDNLPQNMFFHTLKMDHRSGKVEFIGYNLKVTLTSVPK